VYNAIFRQNIIDGCRKNVLENTSTKSSFVQHKGFVVCSKFQQVFQRVNTLRNPVKVIVSRQIRFVDRDVMRKNQLEAVALTGKTEGKRAR